MSGILGAMKKALCVDEGEEVVVTAPATAGTASPAQPGQPAASPIYVPGAPAVDTEFVNALQGVIRNRQTQYTAVVQQAAALESVLADVNVRWKAAVASVMASGGRSVSGILEAIAVHANDIDGEVSRFNAAVESKRKTEVSDVVALADQKLASIEAKRQRIAQLQQDIAAEENQILSIQTEASTLRAQADSANARLNGRLQDFAAAANYVKATLQQSRDQISVSSVLRRTT